MHMLLVRTKLRKYLIKFVNMKFPEFCPYPDSDLRQTLWDFFPYAEDGPNPTSFEIFYECNDGYRHPDYDTYTVYHCMDQGNFVYPADAEYTPCEGGKPIYF